MAAPSDASEISVGLIRGARPVSGFGPSSSTAPVDLQLSGGRITAIAPAGTLVEPDGTTVIDGTGCFVMPGLWDAHVHLGQWATMSDRVDLTGSATPEEALARLQLALPPGDEPMIGDEPVIGFGFRLSHWDRRPSVVELDAVTGDRPVVLISGDAHAGWLNSAALHRLGLARRDDPIDERPWFEAFARLDELQSPDAMARSYRAAITAATARGVVGLADMEFADPLRAWASREGAELGRIRVRAACYPETLDAVLARGLRTGEVLLNEPGNPLVTMGPLKVISDGSLNSLTAYCDAPPHGTANYTPEELTELMRQANTAGLDCAIHAIGDSAVSMALDAFQATGARGSIEHAQLIRREDAPRMARLGVAASVQPVHLLDDREVAGRLWADRMDRCYLFASMHRAGVRLMLGSDAPVAPLDPWLAIAAAVHRSSDQREPWLPDEALDPVTAVQASVDGARLQLHEQADLVVLDRDPGAADLGGSGSAAALVRGTQVLATVIGGVLVHRG